MGRAAEFFTPVLTGHCRVRAVISLSASRAGSDRLAASWPAKVSATATALTRAVYALTRTRPDAVYLPVSQWGLPLLRDVLLVLLARAAGSTVVLHLHGAQLPARLAGNRLLRASLGGCHWLVLGEAVGGQLRASGCRTASVTVLRNPALATPPGTREAGPPRALRVGWIGTMSRAKGFDLVCDAVEQLKRRGVPLEFRVAGMRHDVPPPACVDEDLGVLDLSRVLSFWTDIDAFVLPARWTEGLPFVLLEGLQAGCAVAATPSPGDAELFTHGCVEPVAASVESVTGFLKACADDLDDIRHRQQKAWRELLPRYEPGRVAEEFVHFWRHLGLTRRS
ncbi:glycosyltransferase family 4 protein [Streptomyces sp. NPDC052040]|uniref:glycosyltransferase family 4 protein n=1 Tax=unclassified Streptomyces TaxID=2593676 RepID=UPI0037D1FFA7